MYTFSLAYVGLPDSNRSEPPHQSRLDKQKKANKSNTNLYKNELAELYEFRLSLKRRI